MSAESQQRQSLLGNGSLNTPVAMQWLSSRHVITATDTHAKIEELIEAVFSVRSVPRLHIYIYIYIYIVDPLGRESLQGSVERACR
jgi:hypothetical protein